MALFRNNPNQLKMVTAMLAHDIAPDPVPVLLLPPYAPINPIIADEEEFETYFTLAKELGINNRAMILESTRQILKECEFKVYSINNVLEYLNYKLNNWELFPVREIDKNEFKVLSVSNGIGITKYFSEHLYTKAIPMNILEKMQILSDAVPTARFAISDSNSKTVKDIFLFMCPRPNMQLPIYVCDYWNEATFKDINYENKI